MGKWRVIGVCALLVVLVFAVFGQTIGFGFVNFDDNQYIYENPVVLRGLSVAGLRWALTYGGIGHWHPLTWISHMLDCQLYGTWAGGHHLTNVLLHATAVVLLFLVLLRMTGALWRCAFVATAWAIHPLRAESVAWIAERKDVLSAVFFMLSLGAYASYVRKPSTMRYLGLALVFALGLLSKNMLITLPCVLLLVDYWPMRRFTGPLQAYGLVKEKIPLFILSALSCVITILVPEKVDPATAVPAWLRVENSIVSCAIYLRQTVWPAGLAPFYPNPTQAFPWWQVAGSLALLCLISAAAIGLRKRRPYLLVGWFWFLGMLAPVIGMVQISTYSHADRYTYLPQLGLWIAGTWAAAEWAGQDRERRVAIACVAGAILCTLPVAAWLQTASWRDSETLWTHALESTDESYVARNELGMALVDQSQIDAAVAEFRGAVRLNPAYAIAHSNLGHALLLQGLTAEGIAEYEEALRLNPGTAEVRNNLGAVLFQQGRVDEAISQFRDVLQINPADAKAQANLGNILFSRGESGEGIEHMEKALELEPAAAGFQDNLAWMLATAPQASLRDGARAVRLAAQASQAKGNNNPVPLRTLAAAYAEEGRFSDAVQIAQSALQLAEAQAHSALADALRREIKLYSARQRYSEAH